jgi:hypothetical protein
MDPLIDKIVYKDRSQFEKFNNLEELKRLEIRSVVVELLRKDPVLANTDTSFARKVSGILIRSKSVEDAWNIFRSLKASTQGQQIILKGIGRDEFLRIWQQVKITLAHEEQLIYEAIYRRTHFEQSPDGKRKRGQIRWNDDYQILNSPRRSLEMIRNTGVSIELGNDYIEKLRQQSSQLLVTGSCPILEKIKNDKIFTISGLTGSKASLTIHDLFDHFWTYDLLDREGVFNRYYNFFARVGNPHRTDMFKRESELIASIVFGIRLCRVAEEGFIPIFSLKKIKRILEKSVKTKNSTPNQENALKLLDQIDPLSLEATSLTYTVSNMAIELMEQRRKHGFIKNLETLDDGSLKPVGVLQILDPEYVALIVEINHMVLDPDNRAEQALFNISAIVEDYLIHIANTSVDTPIRQLNVKVSDINSYDESSSSLTEGRKDWLRKNAGFASTKASLC